jgi:hypothetical protein
MEQRLLKVFQYQLQIRVIFNIFYFLLFNLLVIIYLSVLSSKNALKSTVLSTFTILTTNVATISHQNGTYESTEII